MKQRKIIGRFLTANITGEIYDSNVRKAIIINLFSTVAIFALVYFLVGGIINKKITYSAVLFGFLFFTVFTLFVFHKYKKTKLVSIIIVSLMLLLEIALLVKIGENITAIFWTYLFPLLAFFILGRKTGLLFSILLLIISVIIFKIDLPEITHYPNVLHERFIITYIVTALLAYIFENIRSNTFDAFSKANKEKTEYLEETLQQKEEIITQAEILEQKNIELKQLSIVASESDNSIIITDADTKIEWVNKGFTKMLQLTLEEFQEFCPTLLECSENKEKIQQCIDEKQTITYFSYFTLKDKSKIWVQSTATPILNNKNEIVKIVIVETDISQQKIAEQEIKEKNEELNQQRDELLSKNEIISEKNDAIRQSIEYALTIQYSILPDLDEFNNNFENFILYQPKSIVSGDFYWLSETEKYYFTAVVDCTGHGVPGAFMSILGSRILDEIVNFRKINSPAKILERLNKQVVKSLHQKDSENLDGMDIIFCRIAKNKGNETTNITFCGAKRPLIYFDTDDNLIKKIKGIRKSIGGWQSTRNSLNYTDSSISLKNNSILYLTSDGYMDQHNPKRKRIGTNNLLSLFEKITQLNLNIQHKKIADYKENWQENEMQTDDITIWGIKL